MNISATTNKDIVSLINVITIDGPAGSGKSTLAKQLAQKLDWTYCNTGAMYRAVTLACLERQVDLSDHDAIVQLCESLQISLVDNLVRIDNKDVTENIRSFAVNQNVSHVATIPRVRRALVRLQKQCTLEENIVMEGRDIGSVVCPSAKYKFYLDASIDTRAKRRILEYQTKGTDLNLEDMKKQLIERDNKDSYRLDSPLTIPTDAVMIDSTDKSIDQVLEQILYFLPQKLGDILL